MLDPTESLGMALMSGDPELAGDAMLSIAEQEEALTVGELDISASSISFEAGQMEAGHALHSLLPTRPRSRIRLRA